MKNTKEDLLEFLDNVWNLGKDADFEKWGKADCSDWIQWVMEHGNGKEPDWEQVRFNAATQTMQTFIGNDTLRDAKVTAAKLIDESPYQEIAKSSVKFADALVRELQKPHKL